VRELSERLDAIVKEREDVIEAVRKLRGAIQSLNKEGRSVCLPPSMSSMPSSSGCSRISSAAARRSCN
jgi:hypothetical protein